MTKTSTQQSAANGAGAAEQWRAAFDQGMDKKHVIRNRSNLEIKPLYTPEDATSRSYEEALGFPGQEPMTRGIYPTMHRGRAWSQRQLVGMGTPEDYNERLMRSINAGATAISIVPCNSFFRGFDIDEVDPLLVGTCGATLNTVDDVDISLKGVDLGRVSMGLNDSPPFTMLAMILAVARQRGVPWEQIRGTSNQSDYLSHWVALHMYCRLPMAGSRRVLLDHVAFTREQVPGWNPVSAIGQHIQQAGATPAEAMGLTISSALQTAEDLRESGLTPEEFLPRVTFFFDISMSFFEEIAKFRAGRRIWARLVRERFGVTDPRLLRFKFHAQTSGADMTRQQPLNNIARGSVQAMAGIFGGLQSLHINSYDEALSIPREGPANIAVATANILREEAHLADVADPFGGSYYVERLTDEMEEKITSVIDVIDACGGMYKAVETGVVQEMVGKSALAYQERIESGDEKIIGVNAYKLEEGNEVREPLERPDPAAIEAQIVKLKTFRAERDQGAQRKAIDQLARAANDKKINVYQCVVDAAAAKATHGEIIACLRKEMGVGAPLIAS